MLRQTESTVSVVTEVVTKGSDLVLRGWIGLARAKELSGEALNKRGPMPHQMWE